MTHIYPYIRPLLFIVLTWLIVPFQSSPWQRPAILIWRFVGSGGNGQYVAAARLSPEAKDDTEVLSRRTTPSQGGAQDTVQEAPQGETSAAGHMGEPIPMETGEEGRIQLGPQPNTIPEAHTALKSGVQPPLKEGVHCFCR